MDKFFRITIRTIVISCMIQAAFANADSNPEVHEKETTRHINKTLAECWKEATKSVLADGKLDKADREIFLNLKKESLEIMDEFLRLKITAATSEEEKAEINKKRDKLQKDIKDLDTGKPSKKSDLQQLSVKEYKKSLRDRLDKINEILEENPVSKLIKAKVLEDKDFVLARINKLELTYRMECKHRGERKSLKQIEELRSKIKDKGLTDRLDKIEKKVRDEITKNKDYPRNF